MDWKKHDLDMASRRKSDFDNLKSKRSAERDWFTAFHLASGFTDDDGLMPARLDSGELRYQPHQGIKAACMTREDVAAISLLQLSILKRLDRNRHLLYVCIGLLSYVAYRLS